MDNSINFKSEAENFEGVVRRLEQGFCCLDMPDYVQEEFYRGLTQVKMFNSYLKIILNESHQDI